LSNQNLGKAQGRGSSVQKKLGGTIREKKVCILLTTVLGKIAY